MFEQEWLDIFADNLRDIMKEQGYNQEQLADATGLSQAAISRYLSKKQLPNLRAIINMSYELGIDVDEFIDFGERIQ